MAPASVLIWVILILLIILYIQAHLKTKTEYTIVQTYLDKVTMDTLYDKYPVVIYDRIVDPSSLLKSLFAYSYIQESRKSIPPNIMVQNKSKFMILYCNQSDVTVNIISPEFKVIRTKPLGEQDPSLQYVTVSLKKNQVLIMPTYWTIDTSAQTNAIFLDDVITLIARYF